MKTLVVDLDGTLSNCEHRRHFVQQKKWNAFYDALDDDKPNFQVMDFVQAWDGDLVYVTGRPEKYRIKTLGWLRKWNAPNAELFMRKDGDYRPDDVVKLEIFASHLAHRGIALVLDDRDRVVKMWRGLGLPCWQVAAGDF